MERKSILSGLTALCVILAVVSPAPAQRGLGQSVGVVRQQLKTDRETLQGEVIDVVIGPCEKTTGWALQGAHFTIETEKGQFNVHLGPASFVENVTFALKPGQKVTANVFRTDNMDKTHYIAIDVTVEDKTIELRDKNLRPLWAGRPGMWRLQTDFTKPSPRVDVAPSCPQPVCPQAPGICTKPCCPQCRISAPTGRGTGLAIGGGRGMGIGYGRAYGMGRGNGRGPGNGRGRASGPRWPNCPRAF